MGSSRALSLRRHGAWDAPAFIVAEAGVNHEGDLATALRMVREAATAGAGAIKFQVYKAGRIATKTSGAYWDRSQEATESQHALFSKYDGFGEEEYRALADAAHAAGIAFSVSPFDVDCIDWLEPFVDVFKVASGDITNVPLLERVAATGTPVLLSTGASTLGEIAEAVAILEAHGEPEVALLQCTLAYPTPAEHASVGALKQLGAVFPDHTLGYSDHTIPPASFAVIAAAYALGARVIETHFTLDRGLPGNDHYHALDPADVRRLVDELEAVRSYLGPPVKRVLDVELPARIGARRSVVSRVALAAGTLLAPELLDVKRPGGGVSPSFLEQASGWRAAVDIPEDTTLEWHMLAPDGS